MGNFHGNDDNVYHLWQTFLSKTGTFQKKGQNGLLGLFLLFLHDKPKPELTTHHTPIFFMCVKADYLWKHAPPKGVEWVWGKRRGEVMGGISRFPIIFVSRSFVRTAGATVANPLGPVPARWAARPSKARTAAQSTRPRSVRPCRDTTHRSSWPQGGVGGRNLWGVRSNSVGKTNGAATKWCSQATGLLKPQPLSVVAPSSQTWMIWALPSDRHLTSCRIFLAPGL